MQNRTIYMYKKMYIYYADMNMTYLNCKLNNNKKKNYQKISVMYLLYCFTDMLFLSV